MNTLEGTLLPKGSRSSCGTRRNASPGFSWNADDVAVESVPINSLLPADSPRLSGEDAEHVRTLAETETPLPPITVHRDTRRVIDGMHRLRAAIRRGHADIAVRFFDGSAEDAFVLGVRLNVGHGLPLTRADRTAAAKRIIAQHVTWSDRLIASVAGLSAGTIRTLRKEAGDTDTAVARMGRDGRVRPTDAAAGRLAASRVVAEQPGASLREIARKAGVSLGTARDVRERMQHGQDPLPPMQRTTIRLAADDEQAPGRYDNRSDDHPIHALRGGRDTPRWELTNRYAGPDADDQIPDVPELLNSLVRDPSLRFTESGRRLIRWLSALSVALPTWNEVVPTVPSHSAYMVADLARKCALEWSNFAYELSKATDMA
ncbi:transcriptional regulator protein [Krasilnikovia sp. MM14-A1259]|uniref:ParB/RepB/Spo0J family partition protein n=1 Tax=Krasilnikovia sp. MM14-A1259 TaxID=3373539 RepID=UPI00399CA66F